MATSKKPVYHFFNEDTFMYIKYKKMIDSLSLGW